MKIGFATDTNMLKRQNLHECEKTLDVTDIYTEYIETLKTINSKNELVYYMPEIVVEELLVQKESAFNETYKIFEKKYKENCYGLLGELPKNNIKEKLKQEKEEYKDKYKLLSLEYTAELMETLVKEALVKKAPFDKSIEGKKTDAGFKDALIWKTIVFSKDIDKCDEFYFFTSDKAFNEGKEELKEEFREKHPTIKLNKEYKLVDYYIDDGYSGTNFDRPEFQRMLEDIKNKKKVQDILDRKSKVNKDGSIDLLSGILKCKYCVAI